MTCLAPSPGEDIFSLTLPSAFTFGQPVWEERDISMYDTDADPVCTLDPGNDDAALRCLDGVDTLAVVYLLKRLDDEGENPEDIATFVLAVGLSEDEAGGLLYDKLYDGSTLAGVYCGEVTATAVMFDLAHGEEPGEDHGPTEPFRHHATALIRFWRVMYSMHQLTELSKIGRANMPLDLWVSFYLSVLQDKDDALATRLLPDATVRRTLQRMAALYADAFVYFETLMEVDTDTDQPMVSPMFHTLHLDDVFGGDDEE